MKFQGGESYYNVYANKGDSGHMLRVDVIEHHNNSAFSRYICVTSQAGLLVHPRIEITFDTVRMPVVQVKGKVLSAINALEKRMNDPGNGTTCRTELAEQLLVFARRGAIDAVRKDTPQMKGRGPDTGG